LPCERLAGDGFQRDRRRLAECKAQHIGFGRSHFGVDLRKVGNGHERRAGLVLNANHDHLALAHAQAAHDAVDRGDDGGLGQRVLRARLLRQRLRDPPRRGRLGLLRRIDGRLGRRDLRAGGVGSRLGGVVVRLREDAPLQQLGAPFLLLVSLARAGLSGRQLGGRRPDALTGGALFGLEGADLRLGAGHVALGLHRVNLREHLAGPHAVAFPHWQAHNLTHYAGSDVGVAGGDDFSGGRHRGSEHGPAGHRAGVDGNDVTVASGYEEYCSGEGKNGEPSESPSGPGRHTTLDSIAVRSRRLVREEARPSSTCRTSRRRRGQSA
jgi:hypothetical protein